jgi:hypothetical protein
VVAIPAATSHDISTSRELVPEGEGFMSWAAVIAGRLCVGDFVDVSVTVRAFDPNGKLIETLPFETPGSLPSLMMSASNARLRQIGSRAIGFVIQHLARVRIWRQA